MWRQLSNNVTSRSGVDPIAPRLRPCMSTVFSSEKRGCFFWNDGDIERRVPGDSHQRKSMGWGLVIRRMPQQQWHYRATKNSVAVSDKSWRFDGVKILRKIRRYKCFSAQCACPDSARHTYCQYLHASRAPYRTCCTTLRAKKKRGCRLRMD